MIPGSASPHLLGAAAAAGGYQISRSLRFNSADSAHLTRQPSVAGNRRTWTWAGWVKRSTLATGTRQSLFSSTGATNSDWCEFGFENDGTFYITVLNTTTFSNAVYRDVSAWMHIVVTFNTTLATVTDRAVIYINNSRIPITVNFFAQNTDYGINRAAAHNIGNSTFESRFFSGYLADIHFIDGQALDPTSFGEFSATTGVWVPKAYTGTYGTNGFRLDFSDNSAATATTLGKDRAGSNNWTPVNLSVSSVSSFSGYFDGSGDYITAPSSAAYDFGTENWTIEFFFYREAPVNQSFHDSIIGNRPVGFSTGMWHLFIGPAANSPFSFQARTPAGDIAISGGICNNLTWYHVAAVRNGGTINLYVNGTSVSSTAVATSIGNLNLPVSIGAFTDGSFPCRGYVSNVRIVRGTAVYTANFSTPDGPLAAITGTSLLTLRSSTFTDLSSNAFSISAFGNASISPFQPFTSAGNDSLVDVPTNGAQTDTGAGGEVRGNYCTLNPLTPGVTGLSNGNLDAAIANAFPTVVPGSGSWYYEVNGTGYQWNGTLANWTSRAGSHNFGQRPFTSTAPSGFKALCTANLPAPTIMRPSTVMDEVLYTGNGAARSITGLGFNPDLVWIKSRSAATDHAFYDAVRGAQLDLVSNSTAAETTQSTGLTAFNSDGFSIGTLAKLNTNAATYVAWAWAAGGSTVTNTAGTLSSQVRASASSGFSIATYTGNGTSGATIGHGLGVAPSMIIVKRRNTADEWTVYHSTLGASSYLWLHATNATQTNTNRFGGVTPTSTVFTVGSSSSTNNSGSTYVAYCFAPVAGYSAFGSYTGNGSVDGPFVYTGFRPRCIMVKSSSIGGSSGYDWIIHDTARSTYNLSDTQLIANSSVVENQDSSGASTAGFGWDILSNGFKIRTSTAGRNQSGQTYIYAAFAESPFQHSRAR
jgi:hypothetical protein